MAAATFESSLAILKRSDVAFSLGLMTILAIMILPMPSLLLDMALAFSLAFSILIFMTSLFIEKPLEFSSFPTILLVLSLILIKFRCLFLLFLKQLLVLKHCQY